MPRARAWPRSPRPATAAPRNKASAFAFTVRIGRRTQRAAGKRSTICETPKRGSQPSGMTSRPMSVVRPSYGSFPDHAWPSARVRTEASVAEAVTSIAFPGYRATLAHGASSSKGEGGAAQRLLFRDRRRRPREYGAQEGTNLWAVPLVARPPLGSGYLPRSVVLRLHEILNDQGGPLTVDLVPLLGERLSPAGDVFDHRCGAVRKGELDRDVLGGIHTPP